MRVFLLAFFASLCSASFAQKSNDKEAINTLLDNWHLAAAKGDGETYISTMTEDGVFVGTDATEHWDRKAFWEFAKPYFEKKTAWDFKPLQRHIYLSADGKIAWFDEVLDTWMQLCRGSGVLLKQPNGQWKIAQYVLSMTVPNEVANDVIKVKTDFEVKQRERMTKP
ncbi:MAG TPA: nuclear transport factor 2 family protein [Flavobacterium sp.]|nr:nuclear transport factor 2 family protein [Flavobacterium sp.]